MKHYDLIVIGAGPAGEKAAVKAAYFGKSVAIIEKCDRVGGAAINTGSLPSKTLKETSLFISGRREKGVYSLERNLSAEATVEDFMYRKNLVCSSEAEEAKENIHRHKVDLYHGIGVFETEHIIHVEQEDESTSERIFGDYIIIATGSVPFHPEGIPFDKQRSHDSDTILDIEWIPSSICIVGAGVIGCEYATIFSTMGCKVYLINSYETILPFMDQEIADSLVAEMEKSGIEILFNHTLAGVTIPSSKEELLKVSLKSGKTIEAEMFLFAAGRQGNVHSLNCEGVDVAYNKRGLIQVDKTYRTDKPNIYAVGDVIGFPSLASTSMDQGRVAVAHIFQTRDLEHIAKTLPYGIYTIPEVSTVGLSEEQAIKDKVNFCVGRARYSDMPRGKIMGCKQGFLKVIFNKDDLVIRGVHIIGQIATEILHFGMLLVEDEKTVIDVISTVFNYPTLHDLYKYACYDGLGNLSGHKIKK